MINKTNMELILEIVKRTDLAISYNKSTGSICFSYYITNEENVKQYMRQSDLNAFKNNSDALLKYVLEEIYGSISK